MRRMRGSMLAPTIPTPLPLPITAHHLLASPSNIPRTELGPWREGKEWSFREGLQWFWPYGFGLDFWAKMEASSDGCTERCSLPQAIVSDRMHTDKNGTLSSAVEDLAQPNQSLVKGLTRSGLTKSFTLAWNQWKFYRPLAANTYHHLPPDNDLKSDMAWTASNLTHFWTHFSDKLFEADNFCFDDTRIFFSFCYCFNNNKNNTTNNNKKNLAVSSKRKLAGSKSWWKQVLKKYNISS